MKHREGNKTSHELFGDGPRLNRRKPSEQIKARPNLEEPRVMDKRNGFVGGYSANTFQGLVRNYNEDRVSIILNITRPEAPDKWPKCSYFAVFDGHGGSLCSDFLRDHLHKYIMSDSHFPFRPAEALKNGFKKAENEFRKLAESNTPTDKSGSCALVVLIVDKICYVANVGDSRAIMSVDNGRKAVALTTDHKPNHPAEKTRILENGGDIYQSMITTKSGAVIPGPYRVHPGRLSVSRAFGDFYAKDEEYEGLEGVLISDPEITHFDIIPDQQDFILIGCDGIFDKLDNKEIIDAVWEADKKTATNSEFLGRAVTAVLEKSMDKRSMDNVTAIIIQIHKNQWSLKQKTKNSMSHIRIHHHQSTANFRKSSKDLSKALYGRLCGGTESKHKQNINNGNFIQLRKDISINKDESRSKLTGNASMKRLEIKKEGNECIKKLSEYIRY